MPVAGICYGICMVLLQMSTPLVNSIGIATINGGEKMNFGIARGFGSLGYGVSAYLIGVLTRRFGAPAFSSCSRRWAPGCAGAWPDFMPCSCSKWAALR